jgi:hypothetical protein
MATNRLLKSFRTLHRYLGAFAAPALLFFAFTGALQSVPLHEASRTGDNQPPRWLVSIAHLHKKQSLDPPAKRARPKTIAAADSSGASVATAVPEQPVAPSRTPDLVPMKTFFVLVALSLILSTASGVYMGWRHSRNRRRYGVTLAAGIAVPMLLLML